jgi:nucleotidyltransferase/DNA polymerase involved in DNA repair
VFSEYDGNFVMMSLDEAYIDLTDYLTTKGAGQNAEEVVDEIREEIVQISFIKIVFTYLTLW